MKQISPLLSYCFLGFNGDDSSNPSYVLHKLSIMSFLKTLKFSYHELVVSGTPTYNSAYSFSGMSLIFLNCYTELMTLETNACRPSRSNDSSSFRAISSEIPCLTEGP